jgi:hypothetical protein
VFRSVRDLRVRKRMRSSDATCCASMAVNTWFFSPGATTSKILWPPEAPKLVVKLIFMPSFGCPPHWDSIVIVICTPPISSSKISKTGKIKKIRYISVITQKSVILKFSKIDFKYRGCVSVNLQPSGQIMPAYFLFYMLSK